MRGETSNVVETRLDHERIHLAADVRVPAGRRLEVDLALDRGLRLVARRVVVGGAVVALDDRHRAAGLEQSAERDERFDRLRQVLQQEADEDMVERLGLEG